MNKTDSLINPTLLQLKYSRVINLLAKKLEIDTPTAIDLFYRSDTYKNLTQLDNHLHNMSDLFLVDELLLEFQRKQ